MVFGGVGGRLVSSCFLRLLLMFIFRFFRPDKDMVAYSPLNNEASENIFKYCVLRCNIGFVLNRPTRTSEFCCNSLCRFFFCFSHFGRAFLGLCCLTCWCICFFCGCSLLWSTCFSRWQRGWAKKNHVYDHAPFWCILL